MQIPITKCAVSQLQNVDFTNLPFGKVTSDHMAIAEYQNGEWKNARIVPFANLSLSPATVALHYGQSVFEGMKAYRCTDGAIRTFRLKAHSDRINASLARLSMPAIPEDMFVSMFKAFVQTDEAWVSNAPGTSFYIRPLVFATDPQVKVHISETYTFVIFGCPSGPYYDKPLRVKVEETYSRAAPGGVGCTKAAGNYAGSLYPTEIAHKEGFDQILWMDSCSHQYVEESGTMNVMFVIGDTLITPPLGDTILPGITRESILTIAREKGIKVEERPISSDELFAAGKAGTLKEAFGTGTAAVVSLIASITRRGQELVIPQPTPESMSQILLAELTGIRNGTIADTHGWVEII